MKTNQIKTKYLTSQLNIHLITVFTLIFFLLTIIGTLSHEGAHYIVAKYLGLQPIMHFGSVSFGKELMLLGIDQKINRSFFLISIAGPLQTIITGLIGFIILIIRNKNKINIFSKIDFVATFLSLFWLRECFNLATIFILTVYNKSFITNGDESYISNYLGLNSIFLNVILGIVGTILCYYTVFILMPKKYRLNLIVGCFFGSGLGFMVWFYFIGKIVLP